MRADLTDILQCVQIDYAVLDDLVWGRTTRSITSLLKIPSSDTSGETVVDLTGDDESNLAVCVSNQQLKRLRRQTQAMLFWLKLRCQQLQLMVTHFKLNLSDGMRDFYAANEKWRQSSLVVQVCKKARICSKTWGVWHSQWIKNGDKFDRDERGLAQFGWLLVNDDKKIEFTNWLKCQTQKK